MICPVCEFENGEAAVCAECGKQLGVAAPIDAAPEPVEGFEPTQTCADDLDAAFALAALDEEPVAALEDLEPTLLFDPKAEVPIEPLELMPALPQEERDSLWSPGLAELDSGRSEDNSARTPAPEESGPCPFCGLPGSSAVCNNCGRRRRRFTLEPLRLEEGASPDQTTLCPSCFCRVLVDSRCAECHAPLPRRELM